MKKILIVVSLIVGFMVMSLGQVVNARKITIRYGGDFTTKDAAIYQKMINSFTEKYPNIGVEFEANPRDYDRKLIIQFAGGQAPDVIFWIAPGVYDFIAKGMFYDLSSFIAKDKEFDIEDFYQIALEEGQEKGRQYGIPGWVHDSAMYYNKDMFDKEGLDYPNDTWTWNDLLEAAKKLTKRDAEGKIIQYGYTPDGFTLGWSTGPMLWIWANGGSLLNEDKTECTIGSSAAEQGLQWFYDLIFKHKVSVTPSSTQEEYWWIRWYQNTIGIWDCPNWGIGANRSLCKFDWDVASHAKSPYTGKRAVFLQTRGYGINRMSKYLQESWLLIKWFTNKENQVFWIHQPEMENQHQPSRKSIAYEFAEPGKKPANAKVFVEALEDARHLEILPDVDKNHDMWELLGHQFEKVMLQKMTIHEFCQTVPSKVDKIIKGIPLTKEELK